MMVMMMIMIAMGNRTVKDVTLSSGLGIGILTFAIQQARSCVCALTSGWTAGRTGLPLIQAGSCFFRRIKKRTALIEIRNLVKSGLLPSTTTVTTNLLAVRITARLWDCRTAKCRIKEKWHDVYAKSFTPEIIAGV